jgi:hypothetical protein
VNLEEAKALLDTSIPRSVSYSTLDGYMLIRTVFEEPIPEDGFRAEIAVIDKKGKEKTLKANGTTARSAIINATAALGYYLSAVAKNPSCKNGTNGQNGKGVK